MTLVFLIAVSCITAGPPQDWVLDREAVLGTSMHLVVRAGSEAEALAAESAALGEIVRLSRLFSTYDPASEFNRWRSKPGQSTEISPELAALLEACDRWRAATSGAFDPRVAVFTQLWRDAERRGHPPGEAELAAARARATTPAWQLVPRLRTAVSLSTAPLSLDAIAKGTILDAAADAAAKSPGVEAVLLEIGGDLVSRGKVERAIAVASPQADYLGAAPAAVIRLTQGAVATSGATERGFQVGGRWYSHIIDPATGQPADRVRSATVVAPKAEDADALATAFSVLPMADSLRIAAALPGVECLLVLPGSELVCSPGWPSLETQEKSAEPAKLPSSFEMQIQFKINRPDALERGYRRPYVAIWVEDAEGRSVRTVLLLVSMGGPGPRWVTDLKRWYKDDRERRKTDKKDLLYTISKPTRPPGTYEVVWDGLDDHGRPLPPGPYTILIEAAREHGTYQLIREKVTLGDQPFVQDIRGNIEIESARLEYKPATPPPAG